jgi:hypothetical protein
MSLGRFQWPSSDYAWDRPFASGPHSQAAGAARSLPGEGEWLFATLMRQMGIEAPYLLRVLAIEWPRGIDRTSRWRGLAYPEAAVDWFSRRFRSGCRSQRSSQFTTTASTGLLPGKRDRPLTAAVPGGTMFSPSTFLRSVKYEV